VADSEDLTRAPKLRNWLPRAPIWVLSLIPLALVVAIALYVLKDDLARLYFYFAPEGNGTIIVDSPEVYTRERLINDRLEEHLWLTTQLDQATKTKYIFDGYVGRVRTISVGSASSSSTPRPESASELADSVSDDKGESDNIDDPSMIAFDEDFRLRSAIRDQIRQRILENQLDDRHDLYGNSLYVLKFDTTVIPPRYSDKRAYVRVAIGIPPMYAAIRRGTTVPVFASDRISASTEALTYYRDGPRRLQEWLDLFNRWRLDLTTRLDESVAKESEGFNFERWKPEDYEELRSYIRSRLAATSSAPAALLELWSSEIRGKHALLLRIEASKNYGTDFPQLISEFFGARALKLVLGIQINAASYNEKQVRWVAGQLLYSVDPLAQYVDIYLRPPSNLGDTPDFSVGMRWDEVHVTDEQCRQNVSLTRISQQADPAVASAARAEFIMIDRWDNPKRNIFSQVDPQYKLTPDLYQVMQTHSQLLTLPSNTYANFGYVSCSTIEPISLPSGLFNFIEKIARADLYSYAVLPRQSVRATVTEILNRVGIKDLAIGSIGQNNTVTVGGEAEEQRSGATLRATVTSFAATGKYGSGPEDKPEFGWIFDARTSVHGSTDPRPLSESMLAIVSVPAWWEELHLDIETGWITEGGEWIPIAPEIKLDPGLPAEATPDSAESSRDRQTISVVLPNSYEGIDAFLMQVKRRKPVIVEADFEQDELIACAPASLLIRGNRLWRNSIVTLGSQEATTIKVMPNMDGILATFEQVEIPSKLIANIGLVKLRVWTSEGMAELRQNVRIVVPSTVEKKNQALRNCGSIDDVTLSGSAEAK
jgi:hypothetical protein